jgi:RES domain-containing protein
MSTWYRVHKNKNASIVFSGDGGLYVAGRWNYLGKKATYCSESIALCTLEWLSHNGLSVSGFDYYRYSIQIPDLLIKKYDVKDLPVNWNTTPATDFSRDFSDKYLFNSDSLAIAVPSVLIPEEYNLIINSSHSEFSKVSSSVVNLGKFSAPAR